MGGIEARELADLWRRKGFNPITLSERVYKRAGVYIKPGRLFTLESADPKRRYLTPLEEAAVKLALGLEHDRAALYAAFDSWRPPRPARPFISARLRAACGIDADGEPLVDPCAASTG